MGVRDMPQLVMQLRHSMGMMQEKFANAVDAKFSTVIKWEIGRRDLQPRGVAGPLQAGQRKTVPGQLSFRRKKAA